MAITSRVNSERDEKNSATARPATMSATAVRIQARKVRSLARLNRGSGSSPIDWIRCARLWAVGAARVVSSLLEAVSRMLGLLSDPTRLRLLSRPHDDSELSVGDLASRTGVTVTNVSQHLNRPAMAGLVARRRDGKRIHQRIADPWLEQLCDLVCAGVRERAELLAA
jgi:DNA-binding transcriptional ArsR family regulator